MSLHTYLKFLDTLAAWMLMESSFDMMMLPVLMGLLIIIGYLCVVCMKWGRQTSISQSYYVLPVGWGWVFRVVMFSQIVCLLPCMLEVSGECCEWLAFVTMVGIGMVGAAPELHDAWQEKVHNVGGWLSVLGCLFWLLFFCPLVLSGCLLILLVPLFDKGHWKWWVEVVCIGMIYVSLLISIF